MESGDKINKWTALNFHEKRGYFFYWYFKCDCGNIKSVRANEVLSERSKSCGKCTHMKSKDKIYNTWVGMISRCKYKTHILYGKYGGRGITVCDRWKTFKHFYEDMGDLPFEKAQIDRIDNDGNYEPLNCRWVTHKANNRNRGDNRFIEFIGQKRCLAEWAEIYNLKPATLTYRLNSGWDIQEALETRPKYKKTVVVLK